MKNIVFLVLGLFICLQLNASGHPFTGGTSSDATSEATANSYILATNYTDQLICENTPKKKSQVSSHKDKSQKVQSDSDTEATSAETAETSAEKENTTIDLDECFKEFGTHLHKFPRGWMVGIIIVLFIITFVLLHTEEPHLGLIGVVLYLFLELLELYYLLMPDSDPIWFIVPKEVGWFFTIIDFFLVTLFVFLQFKLLYDVFNNMNLVIFGSPVISWGFGVTGMVSVPFLLFLLCIFKNIGDYLAIAFLVYQGCFLLYALYKLLRNGKILWGLFALSVYLITCLCTLIFSIKIAILLAMWIGFLLVILILLYVVFPLLGWGSPGLPSFGSIFQSAEKMPYEHYNDGEQNHTMTQINGNTFTDEHGDQWLKRGDNNFEKL